MKKVFLFIPIIILSIFVLVSCNNKRSDNPTQTDATAITTDSKTEDPTKEELVKMKLDSLPKKDYGGDELRFFTRSQAYSPVWYSREIYAESETNDVINDAVYRRNGVIEDLFKVKITETPSTKDIAGDVRSLILSGDSSCDVFIPSLTTGCTISAENLFVDVSEVPYLDITSPWWDQKALDGLAINNKLFYTIGDISILDKMSTRGIFFNKQIIEDFDLEDPYELVAKNKWTIDKMYEMMKKVGTDVDNDGVRTELDMYGLLIEHNSLYTTMSAMGGKVITLDKDKFPIVTFTEPNTQNILSRLFDVFYDTDTTYNPQSALYRKSGMTATVSTTTMWQDNRALFYEIGFNNLETFRSFETDFGIVPVPKTSPENDWYSAFFIGGPSPICIPITNKDLEKTGIILEALCAESSITLMPAYYETCIQGKYTRDEQSVEMLDIIFANRNYDIGLVYFIANIHEELRQMCANCSRDVASMFARIEPAFQTSLGKIIQAYS